MYNSVPWNVLRLNHERKEKNQTCSIYTRLEILFRRLTVLNITVMAEPWRNNGGIMAESIQPLFSHEFYTFYILLIMTVKITQDF